jgi:hypothetical protein
MDQERTTRNRWKVALLGALLAAVVGVIVLFYVAAARSADEASAWFAAIAAGAGVIALVAAGAGVYIAFPSYRELVRRQKERPDMEVTIQVIPARAEAAGAFISLGMNEEVQVANRAFAARIMLHNAGDAVFRWGILNIQVPESCGIHPVDHDRKSHYLSTSMGTSAELEPGRDVPCNFTVAERDFPPGHHFLYHVEVTSAGEGKWPIAAVLDGYPGKRAWSRAEIRTP